MLTNDNVQWLKADHNFFVKQFVRWRFRFFG
jgi:hypothetical protein